MPKDSQSCELHGHSLIDGRPSEGIGQFRALDPATDQPLEPAFSEADSELVHAAARCAAKAFEAYGSCPPARRADLLEAIAEQMEAIGPELTARAGQETALPPARLQGELGRTCGQLRLFAETLRQHGSGENRALPGNPDRQPLPQPALLQRQTPIGPVAVFGASNFPLAFSAAGGDTAAALAAGCPVVVKGHPAHPGTSELVGEAIIDALERLELPAGVFGLLQSSQNDVAAALVRHADIRAVGFTGSLSGGRALCDVAAARPDPIPVYAEMGSINPVFLLPGALGQRPEQLGHGFAQSLLMGEGQFCTNPGLLVAIPGADLDRFIGAAGETLAAHQPSPMLTATIANSYRKARDGQRTSVGVSLLLEGAEPQPKTNQPRAAVHSVHADHFFEQCELQNEIFGPCSLLVNCPDAAQMTAIAGHLRGQLTATLQTGESDRELARSLLPLLERRVGRIVFNGFPTGVEVSPAMVHGGPWPAGSDARVTSVGTRSMERFQRLICYQDAPQGWLDG